MNEAREGAPSESDLLCSCITSMRATFSIDDRTEASLRRMAGALGTSKSDVVRRAVQEFEARRDRLTEQERLEKLQILSRLRAEPAEGSAEGVAEELRELRAARDAVERAE